MENRICFWKEEFIKHMVLKEFTNRYEKYSNTFFLDLMHVRVLEYIKSTDHSIIGVRDLLEKYFRKIKGKYFQMEQRRILQTEKRNEGVPELLAKVIADAYQYNYEDAFFIGKAALGIKVEVRKSYIKAENKLIDVNSELAKLSPTSFLRNSISNSLASIVDSNSLEGYWLSRFSFTTKREGVIVSGFQYDLEQIISSGKWSLFGKNLLCSSFSGKKYFHDLTLQIVNDYLLGAWYNTNTKNIGTMQLYIHTNKIVMSGKHLGNSNDNSIQEGDWVWIKVESNSKDKAQAFDELNEKEMINIDKLEVNFNKWVRNESPVSLENIIL